MQYSVNNLVVRANADAMASTLVEVDPVRAGWDFIHFRAVRLKQGEAWSWATAATEMGLVVLGGRVSLQSSRANFSGVGARRHVFEGKPYAFYVPRETTLTVQAETDCELGIAWVAAEEDHPIQLITPADVPVEIRGGDNATRQINGIIPPGFPCQRLVIVEVYTPSGGWSSYPPHKHDVHKTNGQGDVLEADLEEIYYYKIDKPDGYAYQRVYTDPESPLHQAGFPIDALVIARNNDIVLVPEGYHPVVSPPGYTTYYLNVLAGSAQSLANSDDPAYAWVKGSYTTRNPNIPLYDVS